MRCAGIPCLLRMQMPLLSASRSFSQGRQITPRVVTSSSSSSSKVPTALQLGVLALAAAAGAAPGGGAAERAPKLDERVQAVEPAGEWSNAVCLSRDLPSLQAGQQSGCCLHAPQAGLPGLPGAQPCCITNLLTPLSGKPALSSHQMRVVRLHSGDHEERQRLKREVLSQPESFDVAVTT